MALTTRFVKVPTVNSTAHGGHHLAGATVATAGCKLLRAKGWLLLLDSKDEMICWQTLVNSGSEWRISCLWGWVDGVQGSHLCQWKVSSFFDWFMFVNEFRWTSTCLRLKQPLSWEHSNTLATMKVQRRLLHHSSSDWFSSPFIARSVISNTNTACIGPTFKNLQQTANPLAVDDNWDRWVDVILDLLELPYSQCNCKSFIHLGSGSMN